MLWPHVWRSSPNVHLYFQTIYLTLHVDLKSEKYLGQSSSCFSCYPEFTPNVSVQHPHTHMGRLGVLWSRPLLCTQTDSRVKLETRLSTTRTISLGSYPKMQH